MPRETSTGRWTILVFLPALTLLACSRGRDPGDFHNSEGFRFTAPPGWVERARADAPGGAAMERTLKQRQSYLPLPRLEPRPGHPPERLVVQYNRVVVEDKAWLRVTEADVPPTTSLDKLLARHAPAGNWKRVGAVEPLEIGGKPAARLAFAGGWDGQDYVCETVAIRQGNRVYFITASLPSRDSEGHGQVRRAVASANWGE